MKHVSRLLGSLFHHWLSTGAAWAAACGQEEWGGSRTGCEGACGARGSLGTPRPSTQLHGTGF